MKPLKNYQSAYVLTLMMTVVFSACNGQSNTIAFEEVDETEVDSIFNSSDTTAFIASKGPLWKTWEGLHKACLKAEFFKKPVYMGISSTVDLGSVYNNSGKVLQWDFARLFNDQERKQVIKEGIPTTCAESETITTDFEALISSELPSAGIEGELSTAIKKSKNITAKIDSWQLDYLVLGELKSLLDTAKSPKVQQFKDDLTKNRYIIATKVARINGFSSIIETESDISMSLKAELENGVIRNIGDSSAKVKYEYASARQIKVSTIGSFLVFAEFMKAKKVNN